MRPPIKALAALAAAAGVACFAGPASAEITTVLNEDFEGLTLGPNQDEGLLNQYPAAFTLTPPAGWSKTNTLPPAPGVTEWTGWSFANKTFWITVSGDQDRSAFTKGNGTVAIVDPDEYDDIGSPFSGGGVFESVLATPAVNATGRPRVFVEFDSDYLQEDTQAVQFIIERDGVPTVLVDYGPVGSGVATPLSNDSPATRNETIAFDLTTDGAASIVFKWRMYNATNDWWWVIDNVVVQLHDGELTDSDNDGLSDAEEGDLGTDPNDADSDDDGLNDGQEENVLGTDPLSDDTDSDGLLDATELNVYGTDPTDNDTDGDTLSDGAEVNTHGTDPAAADSDNDGVNDNVELSGTTNPTNPYSYPGAPARTTLFYDGFDQYADDTELATGGWVVADVSTVENATWTVTNPGGRRAIPMFDGRASGGPNATFLISDSDEASGDNPVDSGASHNAVSPSFSTAGQATVWLHVDVSAQLNDGGNAVVYIEASTDGGTNWTPVLTRVAPGRQGTTFQDDNTNADGFFGRYEADLSAIAGNEADVRLRFRHFEPNDDWWFAIDNVQVDTTPAVQALGTEVFFEDFNDYTLGTMSAVSEVTPANTGNETWTTGDKGNRYTAGAVSGRGVNRLMHPAAEGPGATVQFAMMDSDANPDPQQDEWLISPPLDLNAFANAVLTFKSETVWSSSASQTVLISLDNGRTWEEPIFDYQKGGLADNGEETLYAERAFDISAAGGSPFARVAFRYTGADKWWWAIDDVRVTAGGSFASGVDSDGDGIDNDVEVANGTNPNSPDTDGDGIDDNAELTGSNGYVTDPTTADTDGDGIEDLDEVTGVLGFVTDPSLADTDGDGDSDLAEIQFGADPTDPTSSVPAAGFLGLMLAASLMALAAVVALTRRNRHVH